MKTTTSLFLAALVVSGAFLQAQENETPTPSSPAGAADPATVEEALPFQGTGSELSWITEGTGRLGEWATIAIPEGMGFLNGSDADRLMQIFGNLPAEYEGALATEDLGWIVTFSFAEEGYVKDDEKNELDADALLKTLQSGMEEGNKQRGARGLETLMLEGWAVEPEYNEATNNLEWATIVRASSGRSVNFETRLLGRHGHMNVTLLCAPEELDSILPIYQETLTGFGYVPGKTYAEYRDGDTVAKYGLTALVAGGAAYAAAKTGLLGVVLAFFKKLWYLVVLAVVAVWSGIKRLFGRASGQQA